MTLELIMDNPLAKIVEFLLENPVMDYSKTDLANEIGISRSTLYRRWDILEDLSLIQKSRKYQNTQLYKLDTDSAIVNELGRLKRELEDEIEVKEKKEMEVLA
ncbi:MAG: winged helix-turn-helix domain-containing protein [Candidatus Saliniplasma sp.]